MRGKTYEALALPETCWVTPEMLDALAARDVGHVLRTAQRLTGASQTQIGMSTGLSQAQVSEIMSRKRQVTTIDVMARIVVGLDIPDPARTVLLLGDRSYATDLGSTRLNPRLVEPELVEPSMYADVTAIYPTRSEFMAGLPPRSLLGGARSVDAVGLSLNLICQHYADNELVALINGGTRMRCLFLDPQGDMTKLREREEGYVPGHLATLTELNIANLIRRVRDRLEPEAANRLEIGVYDETVRFNVVIVDDELCIAQPYLHDIRGIESPTFVIKRLSPDTGLFGVFQHFFVHLWERARQL